VALELSRAKWLVGLHSPVADEISRRTVTGGDAAALLAVVDEARRRVRARLGEEVAVAACHEAG
jgi:transposase